MSAHKKGFTLVELLVVISIIAVLSAIGLSIFGSAQKSSRIAKRIGDLKAIQTALELYYAANKTYPYTSLFAWRSECSAWGSYAPNDVIPGLVPTYLTAMPADPSMNKAASTSCYLYLASTDGSDYKLLDYGISEFSPTDYQSQRNLIDSSRDGGSNPCVVDGTNNWAWAILSSSGSCWW